MMFTGIKTEVEPFDVVLVLFKMLSARVYVEIDILQNIAHYKNAHGYIIAHRGCRARRRRYLRDF